jgi:hypothetical protein
VSDLVSRDGANFVDPFIFEDRNYLSFGRTSRPSSTNLMFQTEGKDTCRVSNTTPHDDISKEVTIVILDLRFSQRSL